MATVVTRSLTRKDRFDKGAIRVDANSYAGKYGVFRILLTGLSWTADTPITVDAGLVSIYLANDPTTVLLEDYALGTNTGTYDFGGEAIEHIAAVNLGVPGPSIRSNPDGSWDILVLAYTLPLDNDLEPITLTLTYTLEFIDLSVDAGGEDSTLTLEVDNTKLRDIGYISAEAAPMADKNGYVLVRIKSLTGTVIDQPPNAPLPNTQGDYVPLFTIKQATDIVYQHPVSKISGVRNYPDTRFVFAINNGKGDANTSIFNSSFGDVVLMEAALEKIKDWPCNDEVTLSLTHSVTFTEAGVG